MNKVAEYKLLDNAIHIEKQGVNVHIVFDKVQNYAETLSFEYEGDAVAQLGWNSRWITTNPPIEGEFKLPEDVAERWKEKLKYGRNV